MFALCSYCIYEKIERRVRKSELDQKKEIAGGGEQMLAIQKIGNSG
jgi:hypothetical protein